MPSASSFRERKYQHKKMKLPNWLKVIWWAILILITVWFLYSRMSQIIEGKSTPFDIFVFLIFVALMLVPIFSEVELFGIKLKQELEELKKVISIKFGDLKNDIRNSQAQTIHNTIQGFGPPPPDEKLPELEREIERIVKSKLAEHGVKVSMENDQLDVPKDNLEMFKVRYNIESELRRIWEKRFQDKSDFERTRHQPVTKIINDLTKFEIINGNFYGILREILSICNYAIHGEALTDKQITFVENNAVEVIDYLRQIK
jgi:hypothetical protein